MNIDTLSIARDPRAAELPALQAEAIAAAIGRATTEGVATKGDLEPLSRTTRADLDAVEARLTAKIESARANTLIWLVGTIATAVGILLAAIKL